MAQTTLEQRVATLEKQMARLIGNIEQRKMDQDWKATFGMFANDPEFDELLHLGREIRQQQDSEENHDAGA